MKAKGLKQIQLAKLTGIDTSSISKYMRGTLLPTLWNCVRLCDALDIDLNEMVNEWIIRDGKEKP
jgi:transcriptional regulator with XRE-family HTH domain